MSAFIVSEKHIKTLAKAYLEEIKYRNHQKADKEDIEKIATILWKENIKSVNYRYSERNRISKFTNIMPDNIATVQLIKLIDCYLYQTSEHDNHAKSEAWLMMLNLKNKLLETFLPQKKYENSEWCI